MINETKQTAVEWFANKSWKLKVQLENKEISIGEYGVTYVELLKQAKEIEKKQIIDARVDGDTWSTAIKEMRIAYAELYYNETYDK